MKQGIEYIVQAIKIYNFLPLYPLHYDNTTTNNTPTGRTNGKRFGGYRGIYQRTRRPGGIIFYNLTDTPMFAMFENVSKESIEKDLDLLKQRKRQTPTEATAEREYYKMIAKVKQKQDKARDEFLTM